MTNPTITYNERIAVLDLGTNTFHLLIADIKTGSPPEELAKESVSVKLGEGGLADDMITEIVFQRGLDALHRFKKILQNYSVNKVLATGTAALRTAKNGQEFVNRVKLETGISIKIIDGDREAQLIYEGVRHAVELSSETALITDIGGGSVEFIICNKQHILWKKSYPIGAAKLMARFHHSDPISEMDVSSINFFLEKELFQLKEVCYQYQPKLLIGSAGAFDTFAELEVIHYQLDPNLLKQTEFRLDKDRFIAITDQLLTSSHEQRASMEGLAEIRVDMIIVSSILTRYLLKELKLLEMKSSAYALKEGLLFSY